VLVVRARQDANRSWRLELVHDADGWSGCIATVTTDGEIFEFVRLRPRSLILDALAQAGFRVDRNERKGFRMLTGLRRYRNSIGAVCGASISALASVRLALLMARL
jgi:hypothetical protein